MPRHGSALADFLGPFFNRNHSGAFLNLCLAAAIALLIATAPAIAIARENGIRPRRGGDRSIRGNWGDGCKRAPRSVWRSSDLPLAWWAESFARTRGAQSSP